MKKIITTIITLSLAIGITSSAMAQAAGLSGQTGKQEQTDTKAKAHGQARVNMQEILAKLNLSDDQKAKLKDQMTKNQAATADIRKQVKEGTLTKEDGKKKQQELRKENQKAIHSILTKDQAKQLAALLKEAREKKKEGSEDKAADAKTGTGSSTKGGGN